MKIKQNYKFSVKKRLIYCLPKLIGGLKRTPINDRVSELDGDEDGFMTTAILW